MLVLKRKEGQWLEVIHKSGDVLRMRVYHIDAGPPGRLDIAFDDSPRNFRIERPERILARSQAYRPIELEYGLPLPPGRAVPGYDGPIHPLAGGATDMPMSPMP
ncbi:MAG: hypothetical protein U0800_12235 [Isosphaeraceae bacterium]